MKEGVVEKRANYTESFPADQILATNSLIRRIHLRYAHLRRKRNPDALAARRTLEEARSRAHAHVLKLVSRSACFGQ
jgi:hypothetical protein